MKLLLIADVKDWAWWRRCEGIAQPGDVIQTEAEYRRGDVDEFDGGLFSSWWTCLEPEKWTALVANAGCMYEYPPAADGPIQRFTASQKKNIQVARDKLPRFKNIICINSRCVDFCKALNPRTVYLRTGVDTDFWKPLKPVRTEGKFRVGWCGKPSAGRKFSPKGYGEVLVPLMEALKDKVDFVVNTRTHGDRMTGEEMRDWYNDIDLFLVTSCSEGTPSTLLEAAACGRPFLATDVGIVREVYQASSRMAGEIAGAWNDEGSGRELVMSIAFQLSMMAKKRDVLLSRGDVARATVENQFSWNVLRDSWRREICE